MKKLLETCLIPALFMFGGMACQSPPYVGEDQSSSNGEMADVHLGLPTNSKVAGSTPRRANKIKKLVGVEESVNSAVKKGGRYIERASRRVNHLHDWETAEARLGAVFAFPEQHSEAEINNALALLRLSKGRGAPALFRDLVRSRSKNVRKVAWRIAAAKPSPEMAQAIRPELLESVYPNSSESEGTFLPEIAAAVRAGGLHDAYTYLRQGLNETDSPAFAEAMAFLEPARATGDFMSYLGRAPADQLEKGKLSKVSPHLASLMLKHMASSPPDAHHPQFGYLFLFGSFDDQSIGQPARAILLRLSESDPQILNTYFAKVPKFVQSEFVKVVTASKTQVDKDLLIRMRQANDTAAPLSATETDARETF